MKVRKELPLEQPAERFVMYGSTHVDAVIWEAMRLIPIVPSGLERMTPSEGLWIGGRYIPGDVIVTSPNYTMFRDARFFEKPWEFISEWWTTVWS